MFILVLLLSGASRSNFGLEIVVVTPMERMPSENGAALLGSPRPEVSIYWRHPVAGS